MVHASSANLDTVTGAHVLVALFADPVARFLQGQGLSRYDAVGYICHGIRKQAAPAPGEGEASGGPTTGAEAVPAGSTCEVVLLNDIYTPMEFVVSVLQDFFSMTREQAIEIMLSTHRKGVGSCGVYGQVQAHDLARRVTERARKNQHPLRCIVKTS